MLGGQAMLANGWKSRMGPGRHRVSSGYFWYFDSPAGGAMELIADIDRADEGWEARSWDLIPTNTAVWLANVG